MFKIRRFSFAVALLLTILSVTASFSQSGVWQKRLTGEGESVGINPVNPNTIYAQNDVGSLAVSRDQGKTWTAFAASVPSEIRQIIVHPKDTNTVFITDFFNGLRRSTNGGVSWSIVISSFGIDGESVAYDPAHPDTMFAGNFSDGTLYRSTNRGANWSVMGGIGTNLCALAVRPDSANILLAGSGSGTISKSTNFGATWHHVKSGGSTEIPKIVINRTSPRIAYATAFEGASSVLGVWKSTDAGETWFRTALQGINVWALDIDQSDPNVLYTGTFDESNAGVYKTTDGGASWIFNNSGILLNWSFWNIHIDPVNTGNVYASLTIGSFGQNGIYKYSISNTGVEGFVRDSLTNAIITSGSVTIQPANTSVNLASSGGSYSYYRLDADTSTSQTVTVSINSYLAKQQAIAILTDSVQHIDLLIPPGSIRGAVYNDLNKNGVRDFGEPGIKDWNITLSGQASGSTLSDINGDYSFTDLLPGSYTVTAQARNGWRPTLPSPGTHTLTIMLGQFDFPGKDFGNQPQHGVLSVIPASFAGSVSPGAVIQATFDTVMNTSSFNDLLSWIVSGKFSGSHRGTISFNGAHTVATFSPFKPFQGGEPVNVNLSSAIHAADGLSITAYNYQFTVTAHSAPGSFVGRADYQTGSSPWGIAVGDVDGDGDNDLVIANTNSRTISVLRNDGTGLFGLKADYQTGSSPVSVILADVDLDGDLDVVTANSGASSVSVLRNNGDGTFAPRVDYSVTFAPFSLDVADMNGDGYPDLVTGAPGSGSIALLLNNGSGGFPSYQNFTVSNSAWATFLADLDNDGTIDVASIVSSTPSAIQTFGNLGNGTVGTSVSYTVGTNSRAGIVADVTGDGAPDLIATNSGSGTVSILPKSGLTFGPKTDIGTGSLPWGVASGDLNGDGAQDLAVSNVNENSVSVLTNIGGGAFSRTDYAAGTNPRTVVLADLDGDGDLDLVTTDSGADSVSVFINSHVTTLNYSSGWNLLSLPVLPRNFSKPAIYPSASSNAFSYGGSYTLQDSLRYGNGYWVKFASPGNSILHGESVELDTITARGGWNLVGALSAPLGTGSVATLPPAILASNFYDYDGTYHIADSLVPGRGYWIKTRQPGKIVLTTSGIQPLAKAASWSDVTDGKNTLHIRDASGKDQSLYFMTDLEPANLQKFELPPAFPGEGFGARYASGRMLESAGMKESAAFPVVVTNPEFPITISWSIVDEGRLWRLNIDYAQTLLHGEGSATIHSPASITLEASPGAAKDVPRVFALEQNYPNPFNPATLIQYSIPSQQFVTLAVYNILGQEVARLVNESQSAGFKSVTLNASNLPSGVYSYRLTAGSFTETKKMLLIK